MSKYKRVHIKYKYEVTEPIIVSRTGIIGHTIIYKYFTIADNGIITIYPGYQSDGPSGPTIDTHAFIMASFPHDVIYQCIREGLLAPSYQYEADRLIKRLCIDGGMSRFRAWYVYKALRMFGHYACKPRSEDDKG